MALSSYANAVRKGSMAASRVGRKLELRAPIQENGGSIDVFDVYTKLNLPLLFRPLSSLLGAYLRDPAPGVLVTTQRPMSIQRFTAAHELGHFCMDHSPSLDNEELLFRAPRDSSGRAADLQEVEADAFAAELLMPRWLVQWHMNRQNWTTEDLKDPEKVYQLSLRIGASYEATCRTLPRHNLVVPSTLERLMETKPRKIKSGLLEKYTPESYHGDVWHLTELDAGTRIAGTRHDLFVLELREHSEGGYLWNIDQLRESGFAIVNDQMDTLDPDAVGGPGVRKVTTKPPFSYQGPLEIDERRPWRPEDTIACLSLELDMSGPEEEGLSRAERRILLSAA